MQGALRRGRGLSESGCTGWKDAQDAGEQPGRLQGTPLRGWSGECGYCYYVTHVLYYRE